MPVRHTDIARTGTARKSLCASLSARRRASLDRATDSSSGCPRSPVRALWRYCANDLPEPLMLVLRPAITCTLTGQPPRNIISRTILGASALSLVLEGFPPPPFRARKGLIHDPLVYTCCHDGDRYRGGVPNRPAKMVIGN